MKKMMMRLVKLIILLSIAQVTSIQAQSRAEVKAQKRLLADAYAQSEKGDFPMAEANYRKALAKQGDASTASYNFANLYINESKIPSARKRIIEAIKTTEDKTIKHKAYHNLGNTFMDEKNYKAAVEAYKNALRNNPNDEETRYNYALAKEMLKKENNDGGGDGEQNKDQNKDQEQKDKDQSKDNQSDQDKKDKGDQKDQDQKEGDKDNKKDQEQEKGKQNKNQKSDEPKKSKDGEGQQKPQPKPQKGKLSPEQVQRLLKAIQNQENKIQEKVNAKKAKGSKVKTEKDW
jgi:tetratricopeptide (TPR) repeat protein